MSRTNQTGGPTLTDTGRSAERTSEETRRPSGSSLVLNMAQERHDKGSVKASPGIASRFRQRFEFGAKANNTHESREDKKMEIGLKESSDKDLPPVSFLQLFRCVGFSCIM